jgi:hypothetical protein
VLGPSTSSVPHLVAVTPSVLDTIDAAMVANVGCRQVDGLLIPTLVRKFFVFYCHPTLKSDLPDWSCDEQPKSSTQEGKSYR